MTDVTFDERLKLRGRGIDVSLCSCGWDEFFMVNKRVWNVKTQRWDSGRTVGICSSCGKEYVGFVNAPITAAIGYEEFEVRCKP